jgi:hypothetical protein
MAIFMNNEDWDIVAALLRVCHIRTEWREVFLNSEADPPFPLVRLHVETRAIQMSAGGKKIVTRMSTRCTSEPIVDKV